MLAKTGDGEHAERLSRTLPLLARIQLRRADEDGALETLLRADSEGYLSDEDLAASDFEEGLGHRAEFQALRARDG